jgi:hypothetical protein
VSESPPPPPSPPAGEPSAWPPPAYGPPPPAHRPPPPGYGPPAGYGPPGGYVPTVSRGTDGVAVAAFVLAIVGVVPVALVLGFVALARIRRSGRGGRGLAIASLVISALWVLVVGGLIAVGLVVGGKRDANGVITKPGSLQATELKKGDCLRSVPASDTSVTSVEVTPCTQAHRAEVYAAFDLPDGDYPGDAKATAVAEKGCTDRLPTLPAGAGENLDLYYLTPQQGGWKLGDRSVTCFVVSPTPATQPLLPAT